MDNSFPIVFVVVVTQQPLDAQRESLKPHIQSLWLAGSKQGILYLLFPSIRWWKVFLFLFNENAMIQSRFPSTPKRAIIARSIPSTTKPKLLLGSSSVFSDNIILVLFKRFLTSTRMSILIWNWFPNYYILFYYHYILYFLFLNKNTARSLRAPLTLTKDWEDGLISSTLCRYGWSSEEPHNSGRRKYDILLHRNKSEVW